MKKISTLFKKDPSDLGRIINEVDPQNEWVYSGDAIPFRKFDGAAAAIFDGEFYKRYDVKLGRIAPEGAIPCQEPDEITGHWPHWVKCDRNKPEDQYFFDAVVILGGREHRNFDGTYELVGPKVQGNPEGLKNHALIPHDFEPLDITDFSFESLRSYLSNPENDIEGIVFHHKKDGRMCKIRKSDFGVKR